MLDLCQYAGGQMLTREVEMIASNDDEVLGTKLTKLILHYYYKIRITLESLCNNFNFSKS